MSTIQDTDNFLVEKDGTNYKISATDLRAGTKSYDYLLVNRSNTNYKLAKANRYNVTSNDLLLVERSGINYKVSGSDYLQYLFGDGIKIRASDISTTNDYYYYLLAGSSSRDTVAIGDNIIVVTAIKYYHNSGVGGQRVVLIFSINGDLISEIPKYPSGSSVSFGATLAVGNGMILVGDYGGGIPGNNYGPGAVWVYDTSGNFIRQLSASDGANDDYFGESVAIGDNRIVVGAYRDDDNGHNSGSAYIFDLDGNQLTKITASDGAVDDYFGTSVAIGNNRIVVGATGDDVFAPSSGSSYLFDLNGNQLSKLIPNAVFNGNGDIFGAEAAISGNRIIISAYGADYDINNLNSGELHLFDINGNYLSGIANPDVYGYKAADAFGRQLAFKSNVCFASAPGDRYIGTLSNGSTYEVAGAGCVWKITFLNSTTVTYNATKLSAFDPSTDAGFGSSLAWGNDRLVVMSFDPSVIGQTTVYGSMYIYYVPET